MLFEKRKNIVDEQKLKDMKKNRCFLLILLVWSLLTVGCVKEQSKYQPTDFSSQITNQESIFTESPCFQFSNVESKIWFADIPDARSYTITGNIQNTCMENFNYVCIKATFYDSDNMVVGTRMTEVSPLQHGTSKDFKAGLHWGQGMNQPNHHDLKTYYVSGDWGTPGDPGRRASPCYER